MDEWVHTVCSTLGLQSDTKVIKQYVVYVLFHQWSLWQRTLMKKLSAHSLTASESFSAHTNHDGHRIVARSASDGRFQVSSYNMVFLSELVDANNLSLMFTAGC